MKNRVFWLLSLWCIALVVGAAPPSPLHAFLDRTHAAVGETVTLNIEGVGALSAPPDLSPLRNDFDVLGTSSSSKVQIVNGVSQSSSQLGIALRPKHDGTLAIPPLRIGTQQTQALSLQVSPAPTGPQGNAGDPAFLESSVDSTTPYVGQQILYTLKLYYAGSLTGGQLEDPQADGAQIVHLNGDTRYQTTRGAQTYQVVERHYALIPQRAGSITVRGPTFIGQMLSQNRNNPFDSFFDDGTPVQARASDIALDARAPPAGAGTPWLPAQSVQLKLTGVPQGGRIKSGEPLTLTLTIDAVGVGASSLPQPQLPPLSDARVYPDQTQDATRDDGRWLHATRTRTFAVVPNRAGALTIPEITLEWWNVATDRAEQARIPARTLTVIGPGGATTAGITPAAASSSAAGAANPIHDAQAGRWRDIALASLALWLVAIIVALAIWYRRRAAPRTASIGEAGSASRASLRKRALAAAARGDAASCENAMFEWARAERDGIRNLGDVRAALGEPAQQHALELLQRARWKSGDANAACAAVAQAFARGFQWRGQGDGKDPAKGELPPLYPKRQ